jgi:hypothetical protein
MQFTINSKKKKKMPLSLSQATASNYLDPLPLSEVRAGEAYQPANKMVMLSLSKSACHLHFNFPFSPALLLLFLSPLVSMQHSSAA